MTIEEQLAALKAENEALKAKAEVKRTLSMKVSEKGVASLYGLGRFPVSLYKSQWLRVIGHVKEIEAFLNAPENVAKLAVKE
jgi:hypothetical protein